MTHKHLHRLYVLGMWPCSDKMVVNIPQIERRAYNYNYKPGGEETSSEKKTGAYRYNKNIYDPENQHQNFEKSSLEHHTFPLNGPPFHGRVVNVGLGCNSPLSPSENPTSLKGKREVEWQMN